MNYIKLIVVVFIISCATVIEDPTKDDGRITINIALSDVEFEKGISEFSIDLANVFHFEGISDQSIVLSIDSAVNTNLLTASIEDNHLMLLFKSDSTGFSRIVLKAAKLGSEKTLSFKLTINSIPSENKLFDAMNYYTLGSYESAKILFEEMISINDSRYVSFAYLGLGFTQLKLGDLSSTYSLFEYGAENFQSSEEYQGFKSGLSFLNYSYKKNYSLAIQLGLEVLLNDSKFRLNFDKSIDYLDIRLNVALSQFALKDFIPCYDSIKEIDSAFQLSANDPQFIYKLDQKLQSLISEIH